MEFPSVELPELRPSSDGSWAEYSADDTEKLIKKLGKLQVELRTYLRTAPLRRALFPKSDDSTLMSVREDVARLKSSLISSFDTKDGVRKRRELVDRSRTTFPEIDLTDFLTWAAFGLCVPPREAKLSRDVETNIISVINTIRAQPRLRFLLANALFRQCWALKDEISNPLYKDFLLEGAALSCAKDAIIDAACPPPDHDIRSSTSDNQDLAPRTDGDHAESSTTKRSRDGTSEPSPKRRHTEATEAAPVNVLGQDVAGRPAEPRRHVNSVNNFGDSRYPSSLAKILNDVTGAVSAPSVTANPGSAVSEECRYDFWEDYEAVARLCPYILFKSLGMPHKPQLAIDSEVLRRLRGGGPGGSHPLSGSLNACTQLPADVADFSPDLPDHTIAFLEHGMVHSGKYAHVAPNEGGLRRFFRESTAFREAIIAHQYWKEDPGRCAGIGAPPERNGYWLFGFRIHFHADFNEIAKYLSQLIVEYELTFSFIALRLSENEEDVFIILGKKFSDEARRLAHDLVNL